ncbi:hypothetical protein Phum_PHUM479040 [Pediculus humanus corporis]|uniref:Uncharacterized protein n=1 Tax=Pediculus humanus subsp. corporis TaxID=121224 RepID=E0VWE2_PEDHC|nr:uncharacterized protein Phum_PHUM479040 [Pediculus humanus corporis]EEB17693.1 hypothetical protein Phum_PHUM479040 [Pediculus humanus corporis]
MLEKFKLFNAKDKESKIGTGNSKRTSSSSGFSSAKSEHSDSSTSLCSDAKQIGLINEKTDIVQLNHQIPHVDQSNIVKYKGTTRTKIAKTNCDKKQNSPKLKRMIEAEVKNPKQMTKNDKVRGIADGERKIVNCIDETSSQQQQQTKLNIMESEKEQKPKQNSYNKMEGYQDNPIKTSNSTGIPKPMAAVKGTTKTMTNPTEMNTLKGKSSSVARIPPGGESEKQKRDDVCVAMVSPMRTSTVNDEDKENDDEKRIIVVESDKKLKDVEEEEVMNVKPMSPLMNGGYRLGNHATLHFTHPGCLNNVQSSKNIYYSQMSTNPNIVNLESIDLAMNGGMDMLKTMNKANLIQDSNSGYVSDTGYSKRKQQQQQQNGKWFETFENLSSVVRDLNSRLFNFHNKNFSPNF